MASCRVNNSGPTLRLVEFYKEKVKEMLSRHSNLVKMVEETKSMVYKNAYNEEESLKRLENIGLLQENMSELQKYIYKEREINLKLTAENDKLIIRKADDERKIRFLLEHCGLNESQLYESNLDRLSTPYKRKQKPKVRFQDVKNFSEKLTEFKKTEIDILNLKIQALEAELKEQTDLLQDEIFTLEKDLELRNKEWCVEKKKLEQHVACLNCRLQNVQLKKLDEMLQFLKELEKDKEKNIELEEENVKLRKTINICKDLLGEDFPDKNYKPAKHKEELKHTKEQIQKKDTLIRNYQAQIYDFEDKLMKTRKEFDAEKELFQKIKERWSTREDYLIKKIEEEKTRRLRDGEGFRNDIMLLRSKLKSIDRQIKHHKIKKTLE